MSTPSDIELAAANAALAATAEEQKSPKKNVRFEESTTETTTTTITAASPGSDSGKETETSVVVTKTSSSTTRISIQPEQDAAHVEGEYAGPLCSELPFDKDEPFCLGIDEAGRGSVMGPMVYGAAWCAVKDKERLAAMDLDDSKQLTEAKREEMFQQIKDSDFIHWRVIVIMPEELSGKMLRRKKYNLNWISFDSAFGLVRGALKKQVRLTEVFVDTVGNADKYKDRFVKEFPSSIKFTVCPKADALFPIVSAASICAKVVRDQAMKDWAFHPSLKPVPHREFGSGYPSDPKTKEWMAAHLDPIFGFSKVVRFSWGNAKKMLQDEGIEVRWQDDSDDEAEDDGKGKKRQMTLNFEPSDQKKKRFRYFHDRDLKHVHMLPSASATGSSGVTV